MNFGQPLFLLALIVVPLLWLFLLWAQRRRQQALQQLGDEALVSRLTATVNRRGRRWRQRLWLLGVMLMIVALARPQWGTATQVVQQEGIQIMVVLDISQSMLAQDIQPDRLTRAKQTISELMTQLNGDQVGLVLFAGASFIQFPLTSDYTTANAFLRNANPGMISRPGTALAGAIRTARQGFDLQRLSQKVIVILTDGESHEGDAIAAAQLAAADDILIYTIGFGSADGEPIPEFDALGNLMGYKQDLSGKVILSRLDEATLQRVAETGGGLYFRASAGGQEIDALADIISQLEASQLDSRFEVEAVERFQLFLLLALACFIAAELLPERRRRSAATLRQPAINLLLVATLLSLMGCVERGPQLVAQGNTQFELGEYAPAIESYSAARAAGVEGAEPIYNLANALLRQTQYPEAVQTMRAALDLAEQQTRQHSWFNLGNAYFLQAQWQEAVDAYKQALRLDPNDRAAKYNLELAQQQLALEQQNEESASEPDAEQSQPDEGEEPDPGESDQEEEPSGGEQTEQQDTEAEPTPTGAPQSEESTNSETDEPQAPEESDSETDGTQEDEGENEQPDRGQADPEAEQAGANTEQPLTGQLSVQQARQLLDAIAEGTETLQERLQQIYTVPGGPPSKDY